MGYKKTIQRDEISGLFVQNDIDTNGEVSVNTLRSRMDARQTALNESIQKDWPSNMTATDANADHVTYGNAFSRMPKPSDAVPGSGDRFGVNVAPGKQGNETLPPKSRRG